MWGKEKSLPLFVCTWLEKMKIGKLRYNKQFFREQYKYIES